jgi:hypothetical protein
VTRRPHAIGRLTVLDVVTNDSQLASFLEGLDYSGLHIQCTDDEGTSYQFEWASGYANGSRIRIGEYSSAGKGGAVGIGPGRQERSGWGTGKADDFEQSG